MAELKIGVMIIGAVQTNCYYVYREGEKDVLFFDPADRGDYIYQTLQEKGLRLAGILLTHAHFDHILGVKRLQELSGAPLYAYEGEKRLCEGASLNASQMIGHSCTVQPDHYCKDEERITISGITCKLIATPGHTEGSCCYYFEDAGILISGDTLFEESVGRTDLPTGSMSEIVRSIKEKLFTLPDTVKVYPGHGGMTDIGHEKKYNPFC